MSEPEQLTMNVEHNSLEEDQATGMDATVKWATAQGWELVSVIWSHQDAGGHHHFSVCYNKKPTVKPTRRNKD